MVDETHEAVAEKHAATWGGFVAAFLGVFVGGLAACILFLLLVDPYDVVPFSLPLKRAIVSINERYMYPQMIRRGGFDALIMGSSTSRPLDPRAFDGPFGAHFANLSMNAGTAREQRAVTAYFLRKVAAPKVLLIGLDHVWCDPGADHARSLAGDFPDWLYDDNPWNDFPYLFNSGALEIAGRLVGYQFGLYQARIRDDGFDVATRSEQDYDLARARLEIWGGRTPRLPPDIPPPALADAEERALIFPALDWLDDILAHLPAATKKVLVFTPAHVALQPWPGTHAAALDAVCKARVAAIAWARGATLIDFRIASPITTDDSNYWDGLHYRVPVGLRLARDIEAAVIDGAESPTGDYRVLVK